MEPDFVLISMPAVKLFERGSSDVALGMEESRVRIAAPNA